MTGDKLFMGGKNPAMAETFHEHWTTVVPRVKRLRPPSLNADPYLEQKRLNFNLFV